MTIEDHIDALEACWVDPDSAPIEEVADSVARRAEIIAALVAFDFGTLDAERRASARERLQSVAERDAELGRVLLAGRASLQEELDVVRVGRATARGYASGESSITGRFSGVG